MSKGILEATFTHSKNLALFVFLYKSLTSLMSWLQSEKIELHSFVAAFVGGYIVFGRYNKVNEQVSMEI
jgi:peroxisomal membrane protein 4